MKASEKALKIQYEQELNQRKILEKESAVFVQFNVSRDRMVQCRTYRDIFYSNIVGLSGSELTMNLQDRIPGKEDCINIQHFYNNEEVMERFKSGIIENTVDYRSRQKDNKLHWLHAICRAAYDEVSGDVFSYTFVSDVDIEKKKEIVTESVVNKETDFIMLLSCVDAKAIVLQMRGHRKSFELNEFFDFKTILEKEDAMSVVPEDKDIFLSIFDFNRLIPEMERKGSVIANYRHVDENQAERRITTKAYYLDEMHEDIIIARRDVTEIYEEEQKQKRVLQAALEDAKSASRAKSDFLSNMSHEMRTPMNAIIGMTQIATDEVYDPEITVENLNSIKKSSKYLLSIINDILDMSRIESGKFNLNCEWVSMDEILSPCVDMIKPFTEEKHITFEYPDSDKVKYFEYHIDPLKTKHMLMNLLNNACKFTGDGGTIRLTIKNLRHDDKTSTDIIIVEDNGCGMSEEFLTRIFQPFSQEPNIYSRSTQGTGLGLALARKIALAMGGDIEVESKLGSGSKFSITFPYLYRIKEKETVTEKEEKVSNCEEYLKGCNILLCEDNEINAVIGSKLLSKAGCNVVLAKDGQEGISLFSKSKENEIDAILMDIRMPVMDGLTATHEIRKMERADALTVPIIAMSANAFEEDVRTSIAAGMNEHLAKPVEPDVLYQTLCRLIKK